MNVEMVFMSEEGNLKTKLTRKTIKMIKWKQPEYEVMHTNSKES